jgi:glutathione synthase/RimK-type ligase-like ATP-grasp enzyme
MILICGIPSETPIVMVRRQLEQMRADYVMFNQRQFAQMELAFEISGGRITGEFMDNGHKYRLKDFTGVYTRLMDDRNLPELAEEHQDSPTYRHCRNLHETLIRWCEVTPARVVNRAAPMGSNFSKPYQAQLIQQQGFDVPETLITNNPERVREFKDRHNRIIYKSISGVRSIVQTFQDSDMERLEHIRWCPVQFQEFIEGTDVRVHTIGSNYFATAIRSRATDYRYAHTEGSESILEAEDLPDSLAEKCIKLSRALGLEFAGIDLKMTPDNRVYCFEVNPCPAFSYYEANTAQPISKTLAAYLARGK